MSINNRVAKLEKTMKPKMKHITVFNDPQDLEKYYYYDLENSGAKTPITLQEAKERWEHRDDITLIILSFVSTPLPKDYFEF